MKNLFISSFILIYTLSVNAQAGKTDVLQNLEKNQPDYQSTSVTAELKSASRLFADKEDLTSVIMVIPSGSTVNVLGSDSTYLHVDFEGNNGYINASHAVIKKFFVAVSSEAQKEQAVPERRVVQPQQKISRYEYLENKYGTRIGRRLSEGKIWKGMSSEMVKDSWGSPKKITRVISGNIIKEEWFYKNTWLYIQNSVLAEWGPVK